MSDKFYVGLDITGFENTGKYRPISRVTLIIDDSASVTAGDDSGIEISAQCPHATQAMANALLAQMKGYQYQAFTADAANLDPAAELGDGITANGVYSTLSRIDDDGRGFPNISAPGEVAMEEEYPSAGPMTQEFNRQISETRSQITKTAEEIRLEVSNEIKGLSASISVRLDSITSTVEDQGGQITQIQQTIDSITLSVSNGSTSSSITLSVDGVVVSSQTIQMNGLVTFTGLANGTTTINGSCIKTGLIDAAYLNLTGAITFSDLSTSVQNDIDDAYYMAQNAQSTANDAADTLDQWVYPGTTYIDGTRIMTGTVSASTLEGGEIYLLDGSGRRAGSFTLEGASSYSGRKVLINSGAVEINANYGDIFISSGNGSYMQFQDTVVVGQADFSSHSNGVYSCGTSARRWSEVYASSPEIVTSDRNLKHSINYDVSAYKALFDGLKPCSFQFDNGKSGRTHIGLIAQDVEQAMEAAGLTSLDFAGLIKSPDEEAEGGYVYSLRYEEFISLCILEIQRLDQRVRELEL